MVIAPNPYSPYADADPVYRHVFASPAIFPDPLPGVLATTLCDRLAVVPQEKLRELPEPLPEGICPLCAASWYNGETPLPFQDSEPCRSCESRTQHDRLCALCRMSAHDDWWTGRREP